MLANLLKFFRDLQIRKKTYVSILGRFQRSPGVKLDFVESGRRILLNHIKKTHDTVLRMLVSLRRVHPQGDPQVRLHDGVAAVPEVFLHEDVNLLGGPLQVRNRTGALLVKVAWPTHVRELLHEFHRLIPRVAILRVPLHRERVKDAPAGPRLLRVGLIGRADVAVKVVVRAPDVIVEAQGRVGEAYGEDEGNARRRHESPERHLSAVSS